MPDEGDGPYVLESFHANITGRHRGYKDEAGYVPEGARLGCKLDLDAGTLTFYLNGVKHGPGWTGVVGPVKRCVEMYNEGDVLTLVRTAPAFRD